MDLFNGGEDVLGCRMGGAALREGVGEDVQHHLGVRGGVEVAQVALEDAFDDLADVGEVAVVGEDDAVGRVHVERLGFGDGAATGSGITHVPDAGIAEQLGHIAGVKDVCYEPVALVKVEAVFKGCGDAGSILTAMLKHGKRVVDNLTDRLVSEDTDNSTHRPSLPRAFRNCARVLLFYVVCRKNICG